MESTDDPFLKAWETRQESPLPTVPSNPPEDPWGTVKEDTGRVPIQGNSESTVNSISGELTFDNVFQQCNNFTESAIPNKNNNSHARDTRNSGFDDDFGAWSETDVLFKSGLLDQEFKTVSVTAEEDDLWSSADLSSLNLSLQSQSFVPHDEAERQEEVVSTRRRAFQNPDVIVTSEVGNDDEGINGSGVAFSSKSKLSKETLNQDFVKTGCEPEVDPNLSGSSNITLHNSFGDREGKINANTTVGSAHAVIHSNDIEATAGVPETVDTKGLRVTRPTETVKTSINYTGNVNASSGDATDRSLSHSASSGKDSTSARDTSNAHPRENIPSIVVNSTSGTFLSKTDKIKMGNILDSDKEEPEKMEGEVAITEDTGGEMPPPKTGQVNGENSTPSIDQKETVVLHDEGTEVMVNGDGEEDGDSVNVSLDTETQTREDDFPPDEEYPAEPLTMGEAASKEEGLKDGQLPVSQELIQKDIDIDEDKNNKEDNQEDEKEDSSEGYGSQDADKALESEENGVEDHVKDSEGDTQKKQEVALSQDEGLSSPQTEESKVVSTNNCDQIVGGGLVKVSKVVDDGNVELVNVDDHAPPSPPPGYDEPTSPSVTSGTSSLDQHHSDDDNTTQRTDTFDSCPQNIQITPTENLSSEQGTVTETNITSDNSHTIKTLVHSDKSDTSNVSRMEEEVDVDTEEITTTGDQTSMVIETQSVETNTTGEGRQSDSDVTQVESNQSSTEILEESHFESEQEYKDNTERTVDLEFPNGNNRNMEENNGREIIVVSDTPSIGETSQDTTLDVGVEMTSSPSPSPSLPQINGEESLAKQTKNEEESLKVTQLEEIPQDCDNQQLEVSQECESKVTEEESQLLDPHEELDQNKFEETVAAELQGSCSEDGQTLEQQQQLPEENIAQFVDQVLSHAIEQVCASNSDDNLCKQEDVEIGEKLPETARVPVELSSVTEGRLEDSEMPEETNIDSEKVVSTPVSTDDVDTSLTVGMDQNYNLDPKIMKAETENKIITDNVFVEHKEDSKISREAEQVNSRSEEARSHRWSVPAGQFTAGGFSLANPQSTDSLNERKSESESTEMRKFRPVRFRPTSQMSKDARLRRTSLGVPRGWNAPPVDLLPLEPEVATTKTEPSFKPEESVPSSTSSEVSTSLPVSLPADLTNNTPKVQAVAGLYRSEPNMQASVTEQNLSAPPPDTAQALAGYDHKRSDSSDALTEESSSLSDTLSPPMLPQNKSNTSPHSEAVSRHVPLSPVQTDSQKTSVRNTPPLSQKVEVYQIMEGDPLLSPTGLDKRDQFVHNRSATVGDQPKKLLKSEEERQQVFAALRVKRPIKHKWQGQVELEEKEKEKQVTLDEKSSQSLQKYEDRRKHQSKSFDLGMGNRELSQSKPVNVCQGKNGEGSRNTEREEPSTAHKNRPIMLNFEGSSEDYHSREEVLSPNGDTCSSGYTSGRSTPAGEDASRLLSLPKTGDYQNLVTLGEDQTLPCNEETGLRPVVLRDLDSAPEQEDESSEGRPKSYVKTAVKMREKTSRVNSHVVRQNRISFVEQEVLRHKQQEEDFRREREMRTQELMQQGKSTSPSSPSPPNSTGNSRLQSPTSPEPPAAKPVKAPSKPTTSKAKAVYQELKYNPKTGGGNRSTAMVKEWESKFKK